MAANPQNWKKIKALFEAALGLRSGERSLLLQRNASDSEVSAEVRRLLAEHEQAASFLSTPIADEVVKEPAVAPHRISDGRLLAGRFKIVRFIASGGMGDVYEADDLELHERVAIKTIRRDVLQRPDAVDRLKREVHLARKVTHPNVCRVYDIFRHLPEASVSGNEIVFVSMELLNGKTLAQRLQEVGRFTSEEAFPLVAQMVSALGAAHAAGVVHRDFKPGNVLLVRSGTEPGGMRAVVTDFGLASRSAVSDSGLSSTADSSTVHLAGTLAYMSPEQIEGQPATEASDIYALGLVIYETVTGRLPFDAEHSLSLAIKRLSQQPIPPRIFVPELSETWQKIILRCLEREPVNRFTRAQDVIVALTESDRRTHASAANVDQQRRVLEAAAPKESCVGRAIEIVAMVRRTHSKGLRRYLKNEDIFSARPEDVREKPFLVKFTLDPNGEPLPTEITLRLDSPDFEPRNQIKELAIPPDGDSEPCTFLVRPRITGELVANLELLQGERVVVSRLIRTQALLETASLSPGHNVVSIPLTILVQDRMGQIVAQASSQEFTSFFKGRSAATSGGRDGEPEAAPGEFTRMFGTSSPAAPDSGVCASAKPLLKPEKQSEGFTDSATMLFNEAVRDAGARELPAGESEFIISQRTEPPPDLPIPRMAPNSQPGIGSSRGEAESAPRITSTSHVPGKAVIVETPNFSSNPRVLAAGSMALLFVVAATLWTLIPRSVPVQITTSVDGAAVTVSAVGKNGPKKSCITPCALNLPAGKFSVLAERGGYQSAQQTIEISANGLHFFPLELTPVTALATPPPPASQPAPFAQLELRGVSQGELFIDGASVGKVGRNGEMPTKVQVGQHQVKVVANGKSSSIVARNFEAGRIVSLTKDDFYPSTPPSPEEVAWQAALGPSSMASVEQFLQKYPNGSHSTEARSMLENLYWTRDSQTDNADSYRDYLSRYASGPHAAAASKRIEDLKRPEDEKTAALKRAEDQKKEDQRFQEARNSSDEATLRAFLKEHPSGPQHDQIYGRLDEVIWRKTQTNDVASLRAYVEKMSDGKYVSQAREEIEKLTEAAKPPKPPQPTVDPRAEVLKLVERYVKAYNDTSIQELTQIWPSINEKQVSKLRSFFRKAQNVQSSYSLLEEPTVTSSEATVKIAQVTSYVLKGKQQSMSEHRVIKLTLAPSTLTWEIISVSSE